MDSPYRETEDRLGNAAREEAAVAAFGAWRGRTRAIVLLVFLVSGELLGVLGYALARLFGMRTPDLSLDYLPVFVLGPLVLGALLGRVASTWFLRRRTPAAIRRLAAHYQIHRAVLIDMAHAVERL